MFLRKTVFVVPLASVVILGCASTVHQMYAGPPKPAQDVATLALTPFIVSVTGVDGQKTAITGNAWDGTARLSLLPGAHRITARLVRCPPELELEQTVDFVAEAGRTYSLERWGNTPVVLHEHAFVAPIPSGDEAIIRSPEPVHITASGIILHSIDGKDYPRCGELLGFAIRVPPGAHTIVISYFNRQGLFKPTLASDERVPFSVMLDAGCTYAVDPQVELRERIWSPLLVKERCLAAGE